MTETTSVRRQHYGTFRLRGIATQILGARAARAELPEYVKLRIDRLRHDEERIAEALGRPVSGQRILVVGPGQLLREARYFAVRNAVTCLDLDVIPNGFDPVSYGRMLRNNGPGRVLKTVGRKLIGNDRYELEHWRRLLGVGALPTPQCLVGDICDAVPDPGSWDMLGSWAVFQHVPDVRGALRNCARALRPGGVLWIGVQLWTCNTGHHDIRAFNGGETSLPLWPHLREDQRHLVTSSAWLNQLRLRDWRAAFDEVCPGYTEFQHRYGEVEYRAKMTPELRDALRDYEDEELYTVDVFYRWRKPGP